MNQPFKIITAALLVLLANVAARALVTTAIIPAPAEVRALPGHFELAPSSRILADPEFKNEARLLAADLRPATGFPLKIRSSDTPPAMSDIRLVLGGTNEALGAEGYTLTVNTNGVVIRAATGAGIFYGTRSLLQLLPPRAFSTNLVTGVAWSLPCLEIWDQPRFVWRGFMLDVSRHFFTKREVEKVLDLMALYKLNTFHWHLVDDQGWRLEIKKYPRLTSVGAWREGIGFGLDPKASTAYDAKGRYGGYYTQNEVREVVAYALARHIQIVPEIETPGHSCAALAAYPGLACPNAVIARPEKGGVFNGVYCAGNDQTFIFLQDVLTEVAALFPAPFIHLGGDEVNPANWVACPECQQRIKLAGLKNPQALQAWFTRRMENIVMQDGKRLIGWSEIRNRELAPGTVLMDWIGGGAEAAASGHDVVMSPAKFCYFDYYQSTRHDTEPKAIGGYLPLEKVYQFEPLPPNLAPQNQAHVLGGQANLWTEYVPNLRQVEYLMFPRLGALSEVDWSPVSARDWQNFKSRTQLNELRLAAMGVNFRPMTKTEASE